MRKCTLLEFDDLSGILPKDKLLRLVSQVPPCHCPRRRRAGEGRAVEARPFPSSSCRVRAACVPRPWSPWPPLHPRTDAKTRAGTPGVTGAALQLYDDKIVRDEARRPGAGCRPRAALPARSAATGPGWLSCVCASDMGAGPAVAGR